jgi:hypothetical protein
MSCTATLSLDPRLVARFIFGKDEGYSVLDLLLMSELEIHAGNGHTA